MKKRKTSKKSEATLKTQVGGLSLDHISLAKQSATLSKEIAGQHLDLANQSTKTMQHYSRRLEQMEIKIEALLDNQNERNQRLDQIEVTLKRIVNVYRNIGRVLSNIADKE